MTLRTKLLLWYSGVFFLSASLLVTAMYFLIVHKTRQEFLHFFEEEYEEAEQIVAEHMDDPAELRHAVGLEVGKKTFFPLSYELYDVDEGKMLLSIPPHAGGKWPAMTPAARVGNGTHTVKANVGSGSTDVVYLRTGRADGDESPGLLLRVGMSYKRVQKRLDKLAEYLLYALIVSVLLSFLGGRFLAARSLEPIDEVARSLEHVEAQHLAERLDEPTVQDEVGRIISAANRMLSRLEDSFDRMSRFVGDAAHELRSPLSTLKCRLEVELERDDLPPQYRQALADALEQTDGLTRLVETLLLLARLGAADKLEDPRPVDVALIVEDLREVFEARAAQEGLAFHADCADDCTLRGDATLLRRLLANLMENAICYTPAGGHVEVRAERGEAAVRLTVADTGVGVDAADLDRLFDRFYRAEPSRSREAGGFGLGLSICQRIVELHGGTIRIESEKDAGTTVTVDLPAAPA